MLSMIGIGLIILLIGVILFREEIRQITGIMVFLFIAYALWVSYKPLFFGLVVIAIALFGAGIYIGFLKDKKKQLQVQVQPQPQTQSVHIPEGWYFVVGDQQYGPVTEQELLKSLSARKILPNTPIRFSRVNDWSPANQIWAGRF